jgi:hypothetical protein
MNQNIISGKRNRVMSTEAILSMISENKIAGVYGDNSRRGSKKGVKGKKGVK